MERRGAFFLSEADMKIKHPFALAAPLVFLVLAACDFEGLVTAKVDIECPLPPPIITDTLLTGTFNAACPYYWRDDNDSLHLVTPGTWSAPG